MAASRWLGYSNLRRAGPALLRSSIHLGGRSGPGPARHDSISSPRGLSLSPLSSGSGGIRQLKKMCRWLASAICKGAFVY